MNTTDGNCTHGDLRIAARSDDSTDLFSEGRLEVCVNNAWGTICDTAYSARDADVACSQLGYDDQGTLHIHIMSMHFPCMCLSISIYVISASSLHFEGLQCSFTKKYVYLQTVYVCTNLASVPGLPRCAF